MDYKNLIKLYETSSIIFIMIIQLKPIQFAIIIQEFPMIFFMNFLDYSLFYSSFIL